MVNETSPFEYIYTYNEYYICIYIYFIYIYVEIIKFHQRILYTNKSKRATFSRYKNKM